MRNPLLSMATAMLLTVQVEAAEPSSPEAVVDRQIAAYNANDAEAFANFYAPHARIYDPDLRETPKLTGREAIRTYYANLFRRSPGRRVLIAARIRTGSYITDHEILNDGAIEAIATYEVVDGLIRRAWLHLTKAP